jgi:hypothetical protein
MKPALNRAALDEVPVPGGVGGRDPVIPFSLFALSTLVEPM